MEAMEIGTFRSTYKLTAFSLCISMMYPHPETVKRRIIGVLVMTGTMMPVVIFILIDSYYSLLEFDLLNVIYHSTVVGPYLGGLVKVMISLYMSKEGDELINEIDRDYRRYNTLPEAYQNIAKTRIKESKKYCQNYWSFIVILSVASYPIVSTFLNIKSQLFDENPMKYMVHDVMIPLIDPEDKFETPIFELMYVIMLYGSGIIMFYYLGYDSFFGIAVNHACLKIDMYCKSFEDACKCKIKDERRKKLSYVIQEQIGLFEYLETLQNYFNVYLGVILFAVLIQIGTCLYHIKESDEVELQYMMIGLGSICCIFFPCACATNLKFKSEESATKFYCGGWENIHCTSTRKTILFIITRAQTPLVIKGFNWIIFDMDLFISRALYKLFKIHKDKDAKELLLNN